MIQGVDMNLTLKEPQFENVFGQTKHFIVREFFVKRILYHIKYMM